MPFRQSNYVSNVLQNINKTQTGSRNVLNDTILENKIVIDDFQFGLLLDEIEQEMKQPIETQSTTQQNGSTSNSLKNSKSRYNRSYGNKK